MNNTTDSKPSEVYSQSHFLLRMRLEEIEYNTMEPGQLARFRKDFPWLPRLLDFDTVKRIYVSGIDMQIIDRQLDHEEISGPMFSIVKDERMYFLTDDGDRIVTSYEKVYSWRQFWFFGKMMFRKEQVEVYGKVPDGDHIYLFLKKLSATVINKIRFLVSYDDRTKIVIIYRRPKNKTFWDWIGYKSASPEIEVLHAMKNN